MHFLQESRRTKNSDNRFPDQMDVHTHLILRTLKDVHPSTNSLEEKRMMQVNAAPGLGMAVICTLSSPFQPKRPAVQSI
jgi:hypothetical protein